MKLVFYVGASVALFLVVFSFIVKNPHDIKIHYYFGMIWDGPIAALLLLTLAVGIVFGAISSSLGMLKLKLRLINVANQLRALQSKHTLQSEQTIKKGK